MKLITKLDDKLGKIIYARTNGEIIVNDLNFSDFFGTPISVIKT